MQRFEKKNALKAYSVKKSWKDLKKYLHLIVWNRPLLSLPQQPIICLVFSEEIESRQENTHLTPTEINIRCFVLSPLLSTVLNMPILIAKLL